MYKSNATILQYLFLDTICSWTSYVASSSVHKSLVGNEQGHVDLLPNQRYSVIGAESIPLLQIQGSEPLLAVEIRDAR